MSKREEESGPASRGHARREAMESEERGARHPSGVAAGVYDDAYYDQASGKTGHAGDHPGLEAIRRLADGCARILDCGCGEGAKLAGMGGPDARRVGVEWSEAGIRRAAARPGVTVVRADLRHLPFPDNTFDLVYAAYVFEHVAAPAAILREMIRVAASGGHVAALCPQYGSPFFRSPCAAGNPWRRGLRLAWRDLAIRRLPEATLAWEAVTPLAGPGRWASDWDTTVEPALIPLLRHLRSCPGVRVVRADSFWERMAATPPPGGKPNLRHRIKKALASGPLVRFPLLRRWGPDLFVLLQKG